MASRRATFNGNTSLIATFSSLRVFHVKGFAAVSPQQTVCCTLASNMMPPVDC